MSPTRTNVDTHSQQWERDQPTESFLLFLAQIRTYLEILSMCTIFMMHVQHTVRFYWICTFTSTAVCAIEFQNINFL